MFGEGFETTRMGIAMNVICNKAGTNDMCAYCFHSKTHTQDKDECRFPCGTNQTETFCVEVVVCKDYSVGCSPLCKHRTPHTGSRDCGVGCRKCGPIESNIEEKKNDVKVICSKADSCVEHCLHKRPHEEKGHCTSVKSVEVCCDGAFCIPSEIKEDNLTFILFPKNFPNESRITIHAKDKNEAYKKAVEQLGWGLE